MTKPLVFIFADESCLGNQFKDKSRPGGAGAMLEYRVPGGDWVRRDVWISEPDTTNNRMAILSAVHALEALKQPTRVVFTSDSRYLVDGITKWVHGWAKRGWTRKAGLIENLELWWKLLPVARRHDVQWRWVKGHAGHPQNEYANHLATRAAAEQTQSGGAIPSGFDEWIAEQQERFGRYLDFLPEDADAFEFRAGAKPPSR